MDKQYSVQFFTKFVEAMQKFCRDYIEFEQAVELSGYLSLEIDNYKKERYVLSEMVHSTGDVISESYCVKAFKTMKRLPTRNSDLDFVLRDNTNTRRSGGYADSHTSHQNNSSQGHSYRSRISPEETSHYSNFSPVRRNQPSSFSQSSPVHGRDSQDSFKSKSHTMQIQPRHAIQITESHGQKRVHTDETGDSVNKKEKMDTDLESLYNAATNIVCPSETNETDQNDTGSTAMAESGSANSESVRLPLTDIVAIKEENEVILLDDEGGGPSHMDNAQGNNSNLDSNMLDNSLVSSDMFGSSVSRSEGNASTSSVSNETATSVQEVAEEGKFPFVYSRHPRKSMRERVIKAVCKFPGSVINPRLLQKRLFGAQINQVKIELDFLENCGFGKLILLEKQIGLKPKWRFFKLHPDEVDLNNAQHSKVLSVAGFTVREYKTIFEDPKGCHG